MGRWLGRCERRLTGDGREEDGDQAEEDVGTAHVAFLLQALGCFVGWFGSWTGARGVYEISGSWSWVMDDGKICWFTSG